jgi:hypothetical protein
MYKEDQNTFTRDQFMDYMRNFSASIEDDSLFETILTNVYQLYKFIVLIIFRNNSLNQQKVFAGQANGSTSNNFNPHA